MKSLTIRYLSCTVQSRVIQSTDDKSLASTSPHVPLRTSMLHGQQHLIVPVVALVGNIVAHAANAPGPEFVPMDCLHTFRPATWDLRPVLPGHPQDLSGTYVSAKSPGVYDKHAFGLLFNTRISNGKLLTDAWINLSRAGKVGAQDVVTRLQSGEVVEVSVGINVLVEDGEGEYNDGSGRGAQRYVAKWVEVVDSDHLAMLPVGMEGACSVKDGGCGAGRVAGRVNSTVSTKERSMADDPSSTTSTFDSDKRQALQQALIDLNATTLGGIVGGDTHIWVEDFNDTTVIYSIGMETFERTYTMNGDGGGVVTLNNDEKQVKRKTVYEPMSVRIMKGLGVLGQIVSPGPLRALAGARHSAKDQSMVQAIHDTSADLGASCGDGEMSGDAENTINNLDTPQPLDSKSMSENVDTPVNIADDGTVTDITTATNRTASTCACQDNHDDTHDDTHEEGVTTMNAEEKKALVSKLITAGKFKEDQRKVLESTDDGVLQALSSGGTGVEPTKDDVKPLAVAVDAPVSTPAPTPTPAPTRVLSEAEWLASAPQSVRTIVLRSQREEAARRTHLIQVLSNTDTVKSTLTLEQLTAKPTDELELLGKISGALSPVYDYSGSFAPMTPLSTGPAQTPEELRAAELRRKPLTASRLAYQEKKKNRAV